jgi:hypothetical protein
MALDKVDTVFFILVARKQKPKFKYSAFSIPLSCYNVAFRVINHKEESNAAGET